MDRLKGYVLQLKGGHQEHLHSNMDRLKVHIADWFKSVFQNLHSNMDRLKDGRKRVCNSVF